MAQIILPPDPTWWLLAVAVVLPVSTLIPVVHSWLPGSSFPPMRYGGVDVTPKYQARLWRVVLLGAIALALLGVGGVEIEREKSWAVPEARIEADGAGSASSMEFGLYRWMAAEHPEAAGGFSGHQLEEVTIPWLLLIPIVVYWWEVIRPSRTER